MRVTWAYDRGGHRDSHQIEINDPVALERLLNEIHGANEPVVAMLYADALDEDELPEGLQVGLGHPGHAFVVRIAEDGGYLTDPRVPAPAEDITFDLGGVPTEYAAEHLRVTPGFALQAAVTFLQTGGELPRLSGAAA